MRFLNKVFFKRIIHLLNVKFSKIQYARRLFIFGLVYSHSRPSERISNFIWDEFINFVKSNYVKLKDYSAVDESGFYSEVISIYDWYTSGIKSEIQEQKKLFERWASFKPIKVSLSSGEIDIYDIEKDEAVDKIKKAEISSIREQYEKSVVDLNEKYSKYTNFIYRNFLKFENLI
jgi:hypothetical protein